MEKPLIDVRNVSTRLGGKPVHRDVTLSVRRGELFCLVGENGCGKSTLMREILMLQEPTSGSIALFGQDTRTMSPADALAARRRCGVLFQQGALFSSMTVEDNIAAVLREHTQLSDRFIKEMAALKMSLAGLSLDNMSKLPNELSGGLRRRASLARAIALDPDILFLDEPTAGLDPVSAAGFDELVQRLKELLGLTIVIVTHDLDSLWKVADRVAMLSSGRILGIGTMEELSDSAFPEMAAFFRGPRGRAARLQAAR